MYYCACPFLFLLYLRIISSKSMMLCVKINL
nr:MAG TPA: hypothetical protein [Microviridae sp.]